MGNTETIIENTGKQEFAELLCDFMFKRLFGSNENKDVPAAFITSPTLSGCRTRGLCSVVIGFRLRI